MATQDAAGLEIAVAKKIRPDAWKLRGREARPKPPNDALRGVPAKAPRGKQGIRAVKPPQAITMRGPR